MPKPVYPEYAMRRPLPDVLHICGRCKRGIVAFLGSGDDHVYTPSPQRQTPWCFVCNADDAGIPYARVRGTT